MMGDRIEQRGDGNIGKAVTRTGDITARGTRGADSESRQFTIDDLRVELAELKQHLDDSDRAEIDAAVHEIDSSPSEERFNSLLKRIAGVAAVAGDAGVAVIAVVKELLT